MRMTDRFERPAARALAPAERDRTREIGRGRLGGQQAIQALDERLGPREESGNGIVQVRYSALMRT